MNKLVWTYDKPKTPGLYLACRGDVETPDNIEPFRLVESEGEKHSQHPWVTYDVDYVETWINSFKYAALAI